MPNSEQKAPIIDADHRENGHNLNDGRNPDRRYHHLLQARSVRRLPDIAGIGTYDPNGPVIARCLTAN
ncbi:hypothetical protein ABH37_17290 [Mycobacterium haemophilum]|uniref:Uncharacterized protein n=1 Tax=Mycobacterium haemophilum TaxID=29311 RepID=A0A0I9TZ87_9MYCO|nr:hypothetical protein ABH39_15945 [Mycobacterium haemophilum]KLO35061.1 hypothetical protein ABH38_17180 [Mycobacterium haemophilum]KLO40007.1 hypothetical protein ABH37_17290 [Mycobacterium haemophilum]KLO47336.1 hypothetical protein ABH36_17110 [Mycobacterium haemophilum]